MAQRSALIRIAGIPLYIDRSWFVILLLVTWTLATGYFPSSYQGLHVLTYWGMGAVSAVLLFVCVVLHELGHSLMAMQFGIPVASVTLFIFGGVAQITQEPKRPLIELAIALAGPLVSLAIAMGCFYLADHLPLETIPQVVVFAIIRYLAVINTVILIFNMLPGFPLDGGRILRAVLWGVGGNFRKATRWASLSGLVLSWIMIGFGIWTLLHGRWVGGLWYILLGSFLRNAAKAQARRVSR